MFPPTEANSISSLLFLTAPSNAPGNAASKEQGGGPEMVEGGSLMSDVCKRARDTTHSLLTIHSVYDKLQSYRIVSTLLHIFSISILLICSLFQNYQLGF